MDDRGLARVQVGECVADRVGPVHDLVYLWGLACRAAVQILSLDAILHQLLTPLQDETVGRSRQVGTAECGQELGLGAEVEIVLEGDPEMRGLVEGQVDDTPAFVELALDEVAFAESRAVGEGHTLSLSSRA